MEYCGCCDDRNDGTMSSYKEAGWVKDETIARLRAEIECLRKLCADRPKNFDPAMKAEQAVAMTQWIEEIDAAGRGEGGK
jgi:hypothetical protein